MMHLMRVELVADVQILNEVHSVNEQYVKIVIYRINESHSFYEGPTPEMRFVGGIHYRAYILRARIGVSELG